MNKKCSFEPCEREAFCRTWCRTHYFQQYNGRPMTVFKPRTPFKIVEGYGKCRTCKEWKTLEDGFYWSSNKKRWLTECRACTIDKVIRHRATKKAGYSNGEPT